MTIHHFTRNLWLWKCGLPEAGPLTIAQANKLTETEWDARFEQLMRNRMLMGALRYGPLRAANKPAYNRVQSALQRLNKYARTGNTELLVDVANLCMVEFAECSHPHRHFHNTDDGEHVTI